MYLFFDVETTGLPLSYSAPVHRLDNWPRVVQLAWMLFEHKDLVDKADHIIKPEGFIIPADAVRIHGITTKTAIEKGVGLTDALALFLSAVKRADVIVAHNIDFDINIVGAELLRKELDISFFDKPRYCTMKSTARICGIPGNRGYKWPKLSELYKCLFNKTFDDAHDASADVEVCAKCFFKLLDLGYIKKIP